MIRPMAMEDWEVVVAMFLDWPLDNKGPCTTDRTIGNMRRWLQQSHPFIYEVDSVPVGLVNANLDYSEVLHAVIVKAERGKGHSTIMLTEFATLMIAQGVTEMSFDALDQSKFIADKYHPESTRQGETGDIHRAKALKADFV